MESKDTMVIARLDDQSSLPSYLDGALWEQAGRLFTLRLGVIFGGQKPILVGCLVIAHLMLLYNFRLKNKKKWALTRIDTSRGIFSDFTPKLLPISRTDHD